MKKVLAILFATMFMMVTTGLCFAQGAPRPTPLPKDATPPAVEKQAPEKADVKAPAPEKKEAKKTDKKKADKKKADKKKAEKKPEAKKEEPKKVEEKKAPAPEKK